jgi:peptide/nickel transport system substrate-binding protein
MDIDADRPDASQDRALQTPTLSRRRMLRLFAIGGAGALLAACGSGAAPAQQPTLEVVQPGGVTLRPTAATMATAEAVATTAPTEAATTASTAAATGEQLVLNGVTLPFARSDALIFDAPPLNVFDNFNIYIPNGTELTNGYQQGALEYFWYANYPTGEIVPWLGESHTYNEDNTELTINIRSDITWNDGQPFTADDIVFTMTMIKNDPTLGYENHSVFWESITATDPQTVVITLTEPRPRQHLLFYCQNTVGFAIQPKHIWENEDPQNFKNNPPVTTGPWMLDTIYAAQKMFVWKRNDNYWKKDSLPAAKYLIYRTGPEADQSLPELEANLTDLSGSPGYDLYTANADRLSQYNQIAYMDPCPRGVHFNCAQPPFDKPEFRRAFSMLINRPKIAENIWVPPSQPVTALWADYRNLDQFINQASGETWGSLQYNPERAQQLLTEIGYTQNGDQLVGSDGAQLTFEILAPGAAPAKEFLIAQEIAEEANKLGMQVSVKVLEGNTFWNTLAEGRWACGSWWLCGAAVDPLLLYDDYTSDLAEPIGVRAASGNSQRLQDAQYDEVVNALKAMRADQPEAAELYQRAYDEFMRVVPSVPVIQTVYTMYWNTTYWNDGLDQQSLYTMPFNHWGHVLFLTQRVKPATE